MNSLCPNCGKELDIPNDLSEFRCLQCAEVLWVGTDGRVLLANPITTYLDKPASAFESEELTGPTMPVRSSIERRHRAAQSFSNRIIEQKRTMLQVIVSGVLFLFLGTASIGIVSFRYAYTGADILNWLGALLAAGMLAGGTYFLVWGSITKRSMKEEEENLAREMEIWDTLK